MIKLERNKNTYSILFNKLEDYKQTTIFIRIYYLFMSDMILFIAIQVNIKLYFVIGILMAIFSENEYIFYTPIQLMKRRAKRVAP